MASRPKAAAEDAADAKTSARVKLYPYQADWVKDESRFKLSVKSRQIGWTFGTTFRHVRRRVAKRGLTVWASASQRQSDEAAEYARVHASALKSICEVEDIDFPEIEDRARLMKLWPGRSNEARLIFLPANPDTMRGFSGDVVLDEFGFHKQPKKIWKAALAIASRGYQVEVISTCNGQQGKYWELAKAAGVPPEGLPEGHPHRWTKGVWSVHHIDIFEAVRQGCPINSGEMKAAADDEDTWMQEYCCIFLSDAENYIPMELIVACESDQATSDLPAGFVPRGDLYLGGDIGRKKDRSIAWLNEELGDVAITRCVVTMERVPFRKQFEIFDSLMQLGVRRACLDATGIGAQIAEDLVAKYGTSRVEAVEFNLANKEAMATATKRRFEERKVRIPAAAPIRRAVNAVKRYTSPTGHFRFDAERTDAGHADEFWALALANAAASGPGCSTEYVASGTSMAHAECEAYV